MSHPAIIIPVHLTDDSRRVLRALVRETGAAPDVLIRLAVKQGLGSLMRIHGLAKKKGGAR